VTMSSEYEPRPERPRKLPRVTKADLVHFADEFGRDHYSMEDGRPVCGRLKKAHNREIPDEACLAPPMANGSCKVHGGKAGAPIKHGRYSRVLKTWKGAFERALNDKDLLDTRRELALMDVTIEQLLERIEDLDTPGWRASLNETFQHLQAAVRGKRQGDVGGLLKHLGELIEQGAGIDQAARDLMAYLDKRAARANKMSELELRREEKVTVSEVAVIFAQWLEVLEKGLDPVIYFKLVEDLRRVTTTQQLPGVGVG
jgi:hypothetical protein